MLKVMKNMRWIDEIIMNIYTGEQIKMIDEMNETVFHWIIQSNEDDAHVHSIIPRVHCYLQCYPTPRR